MIDHLDHLVLTTTNEQACVDFYVGLLGMKLETFGQGRKAFVFGQQKINLHVKGSEFEPRRTCRCRARWTCASSAPCRWTR